MYVELPSPLGWHVGAEVLISFHVADAASQGDLRWGTDLDYRFIWLVIVGGPDYVSTDHGSLYGQAVGRLPSGDGLACFIEVGKDLEVLAIGRILCFNAGPISLQARDDPVLVLHQDKGVLLPGR